MSLQKNSFIHFVRVGVALILLTTIGCGGGTDTEAQKLASVSGSVKENDQPLSKVTITFEPQENTPGTKVSAVTDDEGNFQVIYPDGREGLVPGEYQITIYKEGQMPKVTGDPEKSEMATEVGLGSDYPGAPQASTPPKTAEVTIPEEGTEFHFKLENLKTLGGEDQG